MKGFFKNIGPGTLVAAAFIGPGTVTVCTLAGVQFGYSLLWAMLVAITATIILQNMAAKVGLVTQKGLAEVIRNELKHPMLRFAGIAIVLAAIVVGNAAYEAGNIAGGVLGLNTIVENTTIDLSGISINFASILLGSIAFILLFIGKYKVLERVLITMVVLMSITFLVTAIMVKPSLSQLLRGLIAPSVSSENILTIVALIGTTIVPYNLFLHASLVNQKWNNANDLKASKSDTVFAVALGGIVSMSIIVAAASFPSSGIASAADLARSLEPLFGDAAKYFLGLGLFAAGITSAITAPLAAAYVAVGCFGWENDLKSMKFRTVWMLVLFIGVLFSTVGIKPIVVIQFAQVANGILLPVIILFLLWIANKRRVMGKYKNSLLLNCAIIFILLFTLYLGARSIGKVFGLL